MKRASARMLEFAKGLIALEATGIRSGEPTVTVVFAVCEKLRPHLSTFLGKAGFNALLSRALALASTDIAWLRNVHVDAGGSLKEQDDARPGTGSERLAGGTLLLAKLLELLVTFIGEELTLRLMREVWPRLPRTIDILVKEARS